MKNVKIYIHIHIQIPPNPINKHTNNHLRMNISITLSVCCLRIAKYHQYIRHSDALELISPSAAYICVNKLGHHWLAWRRTGDKPWSSQMTISHQWHPRQQTSMNNLSKFTAGIANDIICNFAANSSGEMCSNTVILIDDMSIIDFFFFHRAKPLNGN